MMRVVVGRIIGKILISVILSGRDSKGASKGGPHTWHYECAMDFLDVIM